MPVRALDGEKAAEIRSFIIENADYFARWYNADLDEASADWIEPRLDENWRLVNARIPGMVGTKQHFMEVWPSLRGSTRDDPVTSRVEFRELWELSEGTYLATYIQHYESPNGAKSHPETSILTQDPTTDQLKVQYVHE